MKTIVYVLIMAFVLAACGKGSNDSEEMVTDKATITTETMQEAITETPTSAMGGEFNSESPQPPLVKVVGDILNVRDTPTTVGSAKIGVVLQESVFEILEEAKDEEDQLWYKVEFDTNQFGWIAGWFTESFNNPNGYRLTGEQWRVYNKIQKQMTGNTWYKERLKKDQLASQLLYDFDLDGTLDRVEFDFQAMDLGQGSMAIGSSVITYKDQTLQFDYIDNGEYPWGLTEIGVMDVNSKDQSIEFYIKEGDLVDRVIYAIYRISGGQLMQVTTMSGEILGVYGDNKIYYWGGHLIEPNYNEPHNVDMAIAYYDFDKKDYVTTEQSVGKSMVLSSTVILYKNNKDVMDGAPIEFDTMLEMTKDSRVALLEKGDTIKILEIDPLYNRAKVSTASGHTGWIGGFHMVWD